MKAAVLREVGQPMGIEQVSIAKPQGREVLVRIMAVGVCHSDLHVLDGTIPHPMPAILGHEAAGIVEQIGPDVRHVKPGDHVIVCLTFHCGHCEHCLGGHTHRCFPAEAERTPEEEPRIFSATERFTPFMRMGAFAEQMLVHDSGVVLIRRDMPFDRACLIGCGVTTGFGAAVNAAKVRPGEVVAVIGCGGVGLSAINGAAVAGAGRIIAIDRVPSKLELAKVFGATDGIDAGKGNVAEQVRELTGGRGVDHAIEAIGLKQTIEDAFGMLVKGGTATVVGMAKHDVKVELPAITFLNERRIQGSMMGGVRNGIDVPRYVDFYMEGRLKLDELISRHRPLHEVNEAFDDMKTGALARTVLTFDS